MRKNIEIATRKFELFYSELNIEFAQVLIINLTRLTVMIYIFGGVRETGLCC